MAEHGRVSNLAGGPAQRFQNVLTAKRGPLNVLGVRVLNPLRRIRHGTIVCWEGVVSLCDEIECLLKLGITRSERRAGV